MATNLNPDALKAAQAFGADLPATADDPLAGMNSDLLDAVAADGPPLKPGEPVPQVWAETCSRCRGSGTYLMGTCFACAGRGVREYKTSPEQRAARAKPTPDSRQRYQDRKEREVQRHQEQFAAAHPEVWAWLNAASDRGFRVAQGMLGDVGRFGKLKPNSLAAAERMMAQDKEREEQRAAQRAAEQLRAEPVHAVNLQAVEQSFARAKQQGIQHPKLTLDGFTLKPASESSRNAGAIYVTQGDSRDGLYLGRVLRGEFLPSRECDEPTKQGVLAAMADPLASAVAYGKKYGRCAVCRRELSDPESLERGIGPICADRMGWA